MSRHDYEVITKQSGQQYARSRVRMRGRYIIYDVSQAVAKILVSRARHATAHQVRTTRIIATAAAGKQRTGRAIVIESHVCVTRRSYIDNFEILVSLTCLNLELPGYVIIN